VLLRKQLRLRTSESDTQSSESSSAESESPIVSATNGNATAPAVATNATAPAVAADEVAQPQPLRSETPTAGTASMAAVDDARLSRKRVKAHTRDRTRISIT